MLKDVGVESAFLAQTRSSGQPQALEGREDNETEQWQITDPLTASLSLPEIRSHPPAASFLVPDSSFLPFAIMSKIKPSPLQMQDNFMSYPVSGFLAYRLGQIKKCDVDFSPSSRILHKLENSFVLCGLNKEPSIKLSLKGYFISVLS